MNIGSGCRRIWTHFYASASRPHAQPPPSLWRSSPPCVCRSFCRRVRCHQRAGRGCVVLPVYLVLAHSRSFIVRNRSVRIHPLFHASSNLSVHLMFGHRRPGVGIDSRRLRSGEHHAHQCNHCGDASHGMLRCKCDLSGRPSEASPTLVAVKSDQARIASIRVHHR